MNPNQARRVALMTILAATYIGILDTHIVASAAPTIERYFGANGFDLQLVTGAYAIAYASCLIFGARLGDRLGYRRIFLGGLAAFGLASLACAAAPSVAWLSWSRLAQGLAAALLLPQVLSLIRVMFPDDRERAQAMGSYTAVLGLGALSGQVVGGSLMALFPDENGWRAIFAVNLPIVALAWLAGARTIARTPVNAQAIADWTGAALLMGAIAMFLGGLIALINGRAGVGAVILMASGIALLAVFASTQRAIEARSGTPLVPPALFRDRAFRWALFAVLGLYVSAALQLVFTFYLQVAHGYSALRVALIFLPASFAFVVSSALSARLVAKLGFPLVWGSSIAASVLLAVLPMGLANVAAGAQSILMAGGLVLVGLAQGCVAGPLMAIVMSRVKPAMAGAGSGVLLTGMQLANAIGIALLAGAFFSVADAGSPAAGLIAGLQLAVALSAVLTIPAALVLRKLPTMGAAPSNDAPPLATTGRQVR